MAVTLCRDGIYSDFDRAMSTATLWTWEAACKSWRERPPMHVLFPKWVGYKPPAEPSHTPIDLTALDKPLDPNVIKAMRGEPVEGGMSLEEFIAAMGAKRG